MKYLNYFLVILVSFFLLGCSSSIDSGELLSFQGNQQMTWKFQKIKPVYQTSVVFSDQVNQTYGPFINKGFMLLTESEYVELVNDYWKKNKCQKAFINKHAKVTMVISEQPSLSIDLQNVKPRDKIMIEGYLLKAKGLYDKSGNKVNVRMMNSKQPDFIYINKLIRLQNNI